MTAREEKQYHVHKLVDDCAPKTNRKKIDLSFFYISGGYFSQLRWVILIELLLKSELKYGYLMKLSYRVPYGLYGECMYRYYPSRISKQKYIWERYLGINLNSKFIRYEKTLI